MGDDRIATKRRRFEFLKDHPIADHVLDRIRHHGDGRSEQIDRKTRRPQRREGPVRGRRLRPGVGSMSQMTKLSGDVRSDIGPERPIVNASIWLRFGQNGWVGTVLSCYKK